MKPLVHWLDKTHAGDCLGLLQRMRNDGVRVQTCITSPPYFRLRSYLLSNHPDKSLEIGACETPEQYIARLVQVFHVVREILTDDGTLLDSHRRQLRRQSQRPPRQRLYRRQTR